MPRRSLPLLLTTLLALSSAALAADKIVTELSTDTKDGQTSSSVNFAYEGCEEECHAATLICEPSAAVTFVYADVDAKNAAAAITAETNQIVVEAGGKAFDYSVYEMQFMELTGSWWLTAHTFSTEPGGLPGAIANAKTIEVKAGAQSISLPVDQNVKNWAKACK